MSRNKISLNFKLGQFFVVTKQKCRDTILSMLQLINVATYRNIVVTEFMRPKFVVCCEKLCSDKLFLVCPF